MNTYESKRTSVGYWTGPSRWINTAVLIIVSFIGLDAVLRLAEANESNAIVAFVGAVAGVFLAPFQGMFNDQRYLLTALIAIIGWSLLGALILGIVRAAGGDRGHMVHREEVSERVNEPAPERELRDH